MGRRPGTSPEAPARPLLHAAGRLVGFVLLAGPAVAVLAAIVLLPAYARLARTLHERDCERARTARLEAIRVAQQRLIAALPHDKVLTARLAMQQEALWPANEIVVVDPNSPPPNPPGVILAESFPDPPAADGALIRWAGKLQRPSTRRGLFVLAAGALLAAMLLFASPVRYESAR